MANDVSPQTIWNTKELQRDFDVNTFAAPYVFVTRKSDGVDGRLQFRYGFGQPESYRSREYFDWKADR